MSTCQKWGPWPLVKHSPLNVPSEYGTNLKYYKRYTPRIEGMTVVSSSGVYSVNPLPEGYYVTWSLSDSYYEENCMTQNHSDGTCTIKRNANRDMNNATLTATVHYNGYVATTVSKTIHAYSGLKGTYNYTGTDEAISYPYLIYAPLGCMVTIKSPNLVGATVSYDGDITPTRWIFDEYRGEIYATLPQSSQGQALVNTITCADGELYRLIILKKYTYSGVSARSEGSLLVVSLNDEGESASSMLNLQAEEEPDWSVEVVDVLTNERKAVRNVKGTDTVIDTSGWKAGVYAVRALVGDKVFVEKVIVK
ncbi:MAG: T9SS type A sorting domain-containing protein [Muribaculum sp.]|nr:T9SS type A sorting domain-containing protein [Muribaculum sp.]